MQDWNLSGIALAVIVAIIGLLIFINAMRKRQHSPAHP